MKKIIFLVAILFITSIMLVGCGKDPMDDSLFKAASNAVSQTKNAENEMLNK